MKLLKIIPLLVIIIPTAIGVWAEPGSSTTSLGVLSTAVATQMNNVSTDSMTKSNTLSQDTSTVEVVRNGRQNSQSQRRYSMQFERASLDQVLSFVSRISGMTIVKDATVTGDVTIISQRDISAEDAIDVLNSALASKGYTAIRTGNTLKVVTIDNAHEAEVRVQVGSDPTKIKPGDEIITQVMPLNYADAIALKKDLINLLPKSADLSSNARSNTLIVTSNASNVHRLAQIIKELDSPQASVTQIRVFTLKNADATNLAKTLNDIFKSDATTPQSGTTGGGPGNFFRQFGGGGGGGGGAANAATDQVSALDAALARARASVKITIDDRTNSIIVSAPSADMVVLENLVRELDKDETEQEGTLVVHLQHGDSTSLASMLNTLLSGTNTVTPTGGGGGGGGGFLTNLARATQSAAQAKGGSILGQVKIAAEAKTNSLIFITSPRNFPRIKQMVESLDYARPQVLVEVLVAERTMNDETQLGVEWSLMTSGSLFGNLVTTVATTSFNLGSITQGLRYTIAHDNIQGVLSALKQNTKLNILSTPRILTSDNAAATIKVGQHVPFLTSRQVTDTGSVFNSFSYQDVGITLTVTPHVNPDGYVSMDVHPIVSQLESVTYFDAPVIDNREAQTSVMVKDGETVIVGGLMQTSKNDSVNKVPILGDIPLLGMLFRSTDNKKVKTELMVFLTPHVVHNADELRELSAPDRAKLEQNKKEDEKKDKSWFK